MQDNPDRSRGIKNDENDSGWCLYLYGKQGKRKIKAEQRKNLGESGFFSTHTDQVIILTSYFQRLMTAAIIIESTLFPFLARCTKDLFKIGHSTFASVFDPRITLRNMRYEVTTKQTLAKIQPDFFQKQ
jgi:hypothetical protein